MTLIYITGVETCTDYLKKISFTLVLFLGQYVPFQEYILLENTTFLCFMRKKFIPSSHFVTHIFLLLYVFNIFFEFRDF